MTWCCFHFNNLLLILQIQHSSKHRIHHLPCKIVHPSFLYKYPNLKSQCYFWVFYIASKSSSFPQWSLNLSQAGFRSGFFTFGHLGQPTFQPLPPAAIHRPPIHFLCFSPLFFSQLFVRPPQTAILLLCISFPWGWSWSLSPVQCHEPHSIVHQALYLSDLDP